MGKMQMCVLTADVTDRVSLRYGLGLTFQLRCHIYRSAHPHFAIIIHLTVTDYASCKFVGSAFSALTLLAGWQEEHPALKN